jgi:hypothetical protein
MRGSSLASGMGDAVVYRLKWRVRSDPVQEGGGGGGGRREAVDAGWRLAPCAFAAGIGSRMSLSKIWSGKEEAGVEAGVEAGGCGGGGRRHADLLPE